MKSRLTFILVVCAFAGAPAVADVLGCVDLKETGTDPALVMTITSSGYNGGAYVGIYKINIAAPGYGMLVGDLDSFCIDLWDKSTPDYHEYQVLPLDEAPDPGAGPMGSTRASYLAELLNKEWVAGLTSTERAALQAAVWEVVDEGRGGDVPAPSAFDVTDGTFRVSGDTAVIEMANDMLDSITDGASFASYLALSDDTLSGVLGQWQDYVVRVPLPAAVLLGMLGLGAAGLKLRKFV